MICPHCDNVAFGNPLNLHYNCESCNCGFKIYNLYSKRISIEYLYGCVNGHTYRLDLDYYYNKTELWLWYDGGFGYCTYATRILMLNHIIKATPKTIQDKIRTLLTFS